ncbi:MAG: hypothetical protein QM731_08295 [Chitinophagaceae bacterium]
MRACFLLLLLPAVKSVAQQPADTFLVKNAQKLVQPYERKYIQYTETKDGHILFNAILTRKTQQINNQWLITQTYQTAKSIDTDSSYCDMQTLMPVAYATNIESGAYRERVSFAKPSIHNRIIYNDSSTEASYINSNRYNGVIETDLIATLPLEDNRSFVLKAVNPGLHYTEYLITITVEGKEDITITGIGKIACWRLRVNEGGSSSSTEWYSVNGKQQIKKVFVFKNGNSFIRTLLAG